MNINNKLLKDCIIIGIFTNILGLITEKILYKYNRKNNFLSNTKKESFLKLVIILFFIGVGLHLFVIYSGLEVYCERRCNELNECKYVCKLEMNNLL